MRPLSALTETYVCPVCAGSFSATATELLCARGHRFPIQAGVPRFVTDEGYTSSFGLQWSEFSHVQLDSKLGVPLSKERLFRGTRWPQRMEGERILEAGCGSGRFTEVLIATGASITSFDYSRAAEVAHRSFGDRAQICQASIYEMPYPRASFDRVICYGVLQHCPDVEKAFFSLVEMVRPGGHLAVDVYERWKVWFNARYRFRWLTTRLPKDVLLRWCRNIVPAYMKVVPPLHPWNQLVVPIKDYRGLFPGMARQNEIEMSVLDTMDALSPAYDNPQSMATMRAWGQRAGLVDVELRRAGNGIELCGRRPSR